MGTEMRDGPHPAGELSKSDVDHAMAQIISKCLAVMTPDAYAGVVVVIAPNGIGMKVISPDDSLRQHLNEGSARIAEVFDELVKTFDKQGVN